MDDSYDYIHDPVDIENLSFARIKAISDLTGFDEQEQQIAMRLIHTCGDPEITQTLTFFANPVAKGIQAIEQNCAVLCDVEMVRYGITPRYLTGQAHCFLNEPGLAEQAKLRHETRTMTALSYWEPHLSGAIVLIGNAPTALFRLLEMIRDGAPKPALIVAMPVGFVGAQESKQALTELAKKQAVPYITVLGRRGGSALTVSVYNALGRLQQGLFL